MGGEINVSKAGNRFKRMKKVGYASLQWGRSFAPLTSSQIIHIFKKLCEKHNNVGYETKDVIGCSKNM